MIDTYVTGSGEGDTHPIKLRWRIHEGQIPLRRRHLRALEVHGLSAPLMGWIVERLEWAVDNLLDAGCEGVLVLAIDPHNDVVVSLDEVQAAPALTADDLLVADGLIVGVQHAGKPLAGTIWLERDGVLYASCEELVLATATLTRDLAETLGLPVEVMPQRKADARNASVFLVSDEFGFVPIQELPTPEAPATERMKQCLAAVIQ